MTYLGRLLRVLDPDLGQSGKEAIETLRGTVYQKLVDFDRCLHRDFDETLSPIRNNVCMSIASIIHAAMYAMGRQL